MSISVQLSAEETVYLKKDPNSILYAEKPKCQFSES